MIGFLRFVGLMNAAVWFGAAVYFTFGAGPASSSQAMRDLIGAKSYPYFSEAIGNIIAARFFAIYSICSVVGLLYLMAEWLYFGKYPSKWWFGLVFGLVLVGLARGYWVQPTLKELHDGEYGYGRTVRVEQREAAARAFKAWAAVARTVDLFLTAGLAVYLWRVGNPSEPTRFLSPNKFRG